MAFRSKASFNLLNKADLTNKQELSKFIKLLEDKTGCPVIPTDAKNSKDLKSIVNKAVEMSEPRIQAIMAKGLLRRPARVMVVACQMLENQDIINKHNNVLLKTKNRMLKPA